jgi:hypothetical protein
MAAMKWQWRNENINNGVFSVKMMSMAWLINGNGGSCQCISVSAYKARSSLASAARNIGKHLT